MAAKKRHRNIRPWEARLWYLVHEHQDFLQRSGEFKEESIRVTAVATLLERNRRAAYRLRVRGGADMTAWVEDLRDIVGRAYAVLDNAMWDAATRDGAVKYTPREEQQIYFPIATTSADWEKFEKKKHAGALSAATLDDLRAIQPFVTGSAVASWLKTVNNTDKHRYPLSLSFRMDTQFVMLFDAIQHGKGGAGGCDIDWAEPLPEVRNRAPLVDYRARNAIVSAPELKVPITVSVQVGTEWIDLQDFLWDIMEFVARAAGILRDGDTLLADYLRASFEYERERLAAFRKMMIDEDPLAEMQWMSMMEDDRWALAEEQYDKSLKKIVVGRRRRPKY